MTVTTSVPEPIQPNTRETRALDLFRARGHQIERIAPDVYLVPSCTGRGFYEVDYAEETCTCPDFLHRRENCKHILCVGVLVAKRRAKTGVCAGCGRRFRRRELLELHEGNHDNLTYFHGDRLCHGCANNAGVEH